MFNYRIANLSEFLNELKAKGVSVIGKLKNMTTGNLDGY